MKRIHYILAAALLMCAVGCNKDLGLRTTPAKLAEGSKVSVDFSVMVPAVSPQTKAGEITYTDAVMGETPVLKQLVLAVFGGSVLKEWSVATLGTVAWDEESKLYKASYSAELTYSESPRYIHFIGNPQASEPDFNKNELSLMPTFKSTDKVSSYWQRVVLQDGILPETDADGNAIKYYKTSTDTETTDAAQAADPDEFYYKLDTSEGTDGAKLKEVYLVRNFAKIKIMENQSDFMITRYALINTPSEGAIAPYAGSGFADGYQDVTSLVYDDINGVYPGYMPSTSTLNFNKTAPTDNDFVTITTESNPGFFTYERPMPTSDPMMVIVGGKFTGDKQEYFYKIEIINDDFKYTPIFRNFEYDITYKNFTKEDGETSIQEAFDGYAFGDVSGSTITRNLTTISNATSTITVSDIEHSEVNGQTSWTFTYRFNPVSSGAPNNSLVDVEIETVSGFGAAATNVVKAENDNSDGSRTVTCTLATQPTTGVLKSLIKVTGKPEGGKEIYREITIRVMPKPTATVSCTKLTSDGADKDVPVKISLPIEMGQSLFPLDFRIEASNRNLKSDELPVITGPTLFSPGTARSFHFQKVIQYSEFEAKVAAAQQGATTVDFIFNFKTISNGNAGATITAKELNENCTVNVDSNNNKIF